MEDYAAVIVSADYVDPEKRIMASVDVDALWRVWPQLDERAQNLLEGKYILGMGDSEIGKAFGVSAASVRMMLTRARSKARKAMDSAANKTAAKVLFALLCPSFISLLGYNSQKHLPSFVIYYDSFEKSEKTCCKVAAAELYIVET